MKQAPALLSNRNFLLLWLASIVSNFVLAETWLVINTLGAKEQLGLVMIAGSVPRILLMAVGGVLQGNASTLSFMQSAFASGMVLGGLLLTLYPPKNAC
ncbi:MAG: hypothetical protein RL571_1772 [Pseudomonadota bacterium]|jgi:hypothetical protein